MRFLQRPFWIVAVLGLLVFVGVYAVTKQADNAKASPSRDDPTPTATATPTRDRPWLGLALVPWTDRVAQRLGIAKREGVVVLQVAKDGPAAKAGVQRKDVITALEGAAVTTIQMAHSALEKVKPGDPVELRLYRGDDRKTLVVTAGTAPSHPRVGHGRHRGRLARPSDLQGIPREERFHHLLGGQFSIKDKDGKRVTTTITPGKVVEASDTNLTIAPNDESRPSTYQITAATKTRGRKIADLKAGDKVVVVTNNGSTEASAVMVIKPPPTPQNRTQAFVILSEAKNPFWEASQRILRSLRSLKNDI